MKFKLRKADRKKCIAHIMIERQVDETEAQKIFVAMSTYEKQTCLQATRMVGPPSAAAVSAFKDSQDWR